MVEKARRRQVPAFGEWNYSSSPAEPEMPPASGGAAAGWWYYAPEPEPRSDVCFRYSPPPPRSKPGPKKMRRLEVVGSGVAPPPPETLFYSGVKVRARERPASDAVAGSRAVARAPAKGARRAVRPVDEDLYQVPPPELGSGRPRRKRAPRSLWMGCLGLNCVAVA